MAEKPTERTYAAEFAKAVSLVGVSLGFDAEVEKEIVFGVGVERKSIGYADVVIYYEGKPVAVIEVKRPEVPLSDPELNTQALQYAEWYRKKKGVQLYGIHNMRYLKLFKYVTGEEKRLKTLLDYIKGAVSGWVPVSDFPFKIMPWVSSIDDYKQITTTREARENLEKFLLNLKEILEGKTLDLSKEVIYTIRSLIEEAASRGVMQLENLYRENAEVKKLVDPVSGEVEEEHWVVYKPSIRASDYAEWDSKRHHEVMVDEEDLRLWSRVSEVGSLVNAPAWLRREVVWFVKKARALRSRPEFCGKPLRPFKEKFLLAVYYVVAKKRGDPATAERVATMPCLDTPEPCYLSKRRGDPEFRRYLKAVTRYASRIYPNANSDPLTVLDELVARHGLPIPLVVVKRARELAAKAQGVASGKRPRSVAVAILKIALDELVPDATASATLFKEICRKLRVSEQVVSSLAKKIEELLA